MRSSVCPLGAMPLAFNTYSLFSFATFEDREQVAGRAHVHRLHQAERGRGGHGGVDGVAALLQDVEADLGGERLAGGRPSRSAPSPPTGAVRSQPDRSPSVALHQAGFGAVLHDCTGDCAARSDEPSAIAASRNREDTDFN